jgi:hypothetical protein
MGGEVGVRGGGRFGMVGSGKQGLFVSTSLLKKEKS